MIKDELKEERDNREKLAIAEACRSYLYLNKMLIEAENDKVHQRIKKFQDKNEIEISPEQLDSADFLYQD